ncbi:zinc metalloprotease HtpX [Pyrobaculum aerophilum]|nr:zinc metalloprotease HtpX [Pyrobaculum aerophilum]MCX8137613.1 zinc metalloprotease HtpX [Pyrobaculum aerophilum]
MDYGLLALLYIAALAASIHFVPRTAGARRWKYAFYGSMALILAAIVAVAYAVLAPLLFPAVVLTQAALGIKDYITAFAVLAAVSAAAMYIISPYIINAVFGPRPDPGLQQLVDAVAAKLGGRVKARAVVVEGPPNAFAYGNFLTGKYVAVTTGLLNTASRDELEAVIGHELGHHINKDMPIMTALGILPSIAFFTGVAAIHLGLADRERPSILAIAYGVVMIVVSFIVQLLVLSFSRLREYYADMHGARAAGKDAMMRALAKIHKYYAQNPEALATSPKISGFKALFIYALVNAAANPLIDITPEEVRQLMRLQTSWLDEILSSHPPIPKRLKVLSALAAP